MNNRNQEANHTPSRVPRSAYMKSRFLKSLQNGKIVDSAIAISFMLLSAWLIYCLVRPFLDYDITS